MGSDVNVRMVRVLVGTPEKLGRGKRGHWDGESYQEIRKIGNGKSQVGSRIVEELGGQKDTKGKPEENKSSCVMKETLRCRLPHVQRKDAKVQGYKEFEAEN